jgi:catechol 2,3-dioxygenase-like lactoylglutathione lyase family enzyme
VVAQAFRLCGADLRVDHVTVAGKDLRKMQSALEAAGLKSEYGGPHANHATEMALVSFPDGSYLELIAVQPKADPAAVRQHTWARQLESNAGPCAWAIRSADVDTEVRRLRATGLEVQPPIRNGRARPDGYRLDWQTAQVGRDGNGTFFPFLIQDFTPRDKRAFPSGKPTSAEYTGVARVVIAVRDLDSAIARYRKAFDLPEPKREDDAVFGAKLAWFPGTPVILAAPVGAASWLARRIDSFGEAPCAFILGGKVQPAPASTWFGHAIQWSDPEKLGWRLGVEVKAG